MGFRTLGLVLLAIGLIAPGVGVSAQSGGLPSGGASGESAGSIIEIANPEPGEYIVVFKDDIGEDDVDGSKDDMLAQYGGSEKQIFKSAVRGFSAVMTEAQALAHSTDSKVLFVQENGWLDLSGSETPTPSWGLDRIDQELSVATNPDNTYNYSQSGIGVDLYVIDSGINPSHSDFAGRIALIKDFIDDDRNSATPKNNDDPDPSTQDGVDCAGNGHGTHVAGIAAGTSYGVAKNVSIHSLRVFRCGTPSLGLVDDVMAAVDYVTKQHDPARPAVVNLSFISAGVVPSLDRSIRRCIASGVATIIAAGNFYQSIDTFAYSPTTVTQATIVGSTTIADQMATTANAPTGSNYGTKLDLFGPGVNITSAGRLGVSSQQILSGTSQASPHVAGVAAQYLEVNPKACPCTVNAQLVAGATNNRLTLPAVAVTAGTVNKLVRVPATPGWTAQPVRSLNAAQAFVHVPNTGANLGVSLAITGPITVEAWVKLSSNTTVQDILTRYTTAGSGGTNGYGLRLTSNGKLRFTIYSSSGTSASVTGSTTLATGQWYHVAGIYDGTQVRLFVNGSANGSASTTVVLGGGGTPSLRIASSPGGSNRFTGLIDEVRVTARAVYSSSFAPANRLAGIKDTKGLWRFDDQNVKDCADINNGTAGSHAFVTDVP